MNHPHYAINHSAKIAFVIITSISTIGSLSGFAIKDINPQWPWWKWTIIIGIAFFILFVITFSITLLSSHKPCKIIINGKPVEITTGDIFNETGFKIIPFNDHFDTIVDDIIIAHNSLNGIMIDKYVKDIGSLNDSIEKAQNDSSTLKPKKEKNRYVYPLGRIIPYDSFLMLAFSQFDNQNRAYLEIGEYEQLLIQMWPEIRRTYAGKSIAIPLLGTGITTISGVKEKNYTEMLRCILCTLKSSGFQPENGIRIIIKKEIISKIDFNTIKGEF